MSKILMMVGLALWLVVPLSVSRAENEASYYPNGLLYIPHVNLLDGQSNTVRSYSVHMRKIGRGWTFKLFGAGDVSTHASVTGSWSFAFVNNFKHTFDGTNFAETTLSAPVTNRIPLTLTQVGPSVSGTGTSNSIRYSLVGEVNGKQFNFTLLGGASNATITAAFGQATVNSNVMQGGYFGSASNSVEVREGAFSASKN